MVTAASEEASPVTIPFPGAHAPLVNGTRLPVPLTPLVGREDELAGILALLREEGVRLITLTGPGGVGKTRLAIRAAELAAPGFRDGVVFAELAPLGDPGLVIPTLAHACGLREAGDRDLLIVLDNMEHLLAAVPEISALLGAAPGLRVLATSRVVLRLSGEQDFPVPPLTVPADDRPSLAQVADAEANRLFVERACRPTRFRPRRGQCPDRRGLPRWWRRVCCGRMRKRHPEGTRNRAMGCWRRCAPSPPSTWPRAASRTRSRTGTPAITWRRPSRPTIHRTPRPRFGSTASNATTATTAARSFG